MCMINEMNSRIKELEQQLQENDIALMGLRAKIDHITVHAVDSYPVYVTHWMPLPDAPR